MSSGFWNCNICDPLRGSKKRKYMDMSSMMRTKFVKGASGSEDRVRVKTGAKSTPRK